MATIRNVSGQDLDVPGYGTVEVDTVIDVPDDVVDAYTCQVSNWDTVGFVSSDDDD